MSTVVPHIAAGTIPHDQAKLDPGRRATTVRGLLECLIVSPSATRRELLSRAAAAGGWSSVVCGDAETARRQAQRIAIQLALIDLERASAAEMRGLREVSAELSQLGNPLLVVCGADGDIQQEIWARQLGAWLYLPGIGGVEAMAQLCDEARLIVERMKQRNGVHGH